MCLYSRLVRAGGSYRARGWRQWSGLSSESAIRCRAACCVHSRRGLGVQVEDSPGGAGGPVRALYRVPCADEMCGFRGERSDGEGNIDATWAT
eukprot:3597605-Prymnesium_polylepis.1